MQSRTGMRKGVATVELAIVLPFLLLLVFGVVDFGRLILVDNEITNLSREAANLAWRGTPFPDTIDAVFQASGDSDGNGIPDLRQNGYIILSRVERDQNDNPVIISQAARGNQVRPSRVGVVGGAIILPVPQLPRTGQQLIIAEVFMNYTPVTPVGALFGSSLPTHLYDAAFFY